MQPKPSKFFSPARVMKDIRAIVSHTRWMTTPQIQKAAKYIESSFRQISGLDEIELVECPADGKTFYGGWVMPKAWDVRGAKLSVLPGNGRDEMLLADYRQNPFSLMMWSPPTPKSGVEAEVVVVDKPFVNGARLKGKIALFSDVGQIAVDEVIWAAKCGAVAFVTDSMVLKKGSKEGRYLDDAVQYWNYSNPQWDHDPRLPAFGLTPATGRKLRALIAREKKVRLRAWVEARLYNGVMPLVTARLPGSGRGEFVLTAHMDEPGASDNTSGTAIAMEIMRALAEYVRATGRRLKYSVRFFGSVEARGLQAYLNTRRYGHGVVGGLNLDMLAYDHTVGRTKFSIISALPSAPSALEFLLGELTEQEARKKPLFKWESDRGVYINDCHFAGAPFNAPMCALEQAPDRTYHCSLDTPKNLSPRHIGRTGNIALEATRFFTECNPDEIEHLGKSVYSRALTAAKKKDGAETVAALIEVLGELTHLIEEGPVTPNEQAVEEMRRTNRLIQGFLYPKFAFEAQVAEWKKELTQLCPIKKKAAKLSRKDQKLSAVARKMVPLKRFNGYLAFEDLTQAQKKKLLKETGLHAGWAVSGTVQHALDLCNGKRSLLDIQTQMGRYGSAPPLDFLIKVLRYLEKSGKVRMRTVLQKKDVLAAIRAVGIKPGDLIVAHSSLSDFGYLEGGAEALVDCLLEAVGKEGTVCVPTHSLNWIGKPPYDPKTSPSLTGIIPQTFLRRPEALRSLHPTHSVAAIGPLAARLLEGHDHRVAPQGREGFWGNFVEANGKVLMLCKLGSNTLLHGGELWAGTPYPPCQCHFLRNGERVECTVPGMPWHTHAFDHTHDRLRKRRRLFEAKLGESTIHSMYAREAVEEMMQIIRENPEVAIAPKCKCYYCNYLREHLNGSTKSEARISRQIQKVES